MALMIGALGAYAIYVLTVAGTIVADTYDRPLMAINFARSASQIFTAMDKEVLRRSTVPPAAQQEIERHIDQLAHSFSDDLAIAEERALSEQERGIIQQIRQLVGEWNDLRRSQSLDDIAPQLYRLAEDIIDRFDILTELTAEHGFVERRQGISAISRFKYISIGGALLAFMLAAAITLGLASRIIQPLAASARIADRIAKGELNTPIPSGGKDETGILLRSMTVMQDNIRVMMERETAQRQSAQNRLIDALESSREGMLLVDAEGRIVMVNSQVAAFFPRVAHYFTQGAEFSAAFALIHTQLKQPADSSAAEAAFSQILDRGGEAQLTDGRWIRVSRSNTHDGGFFLFLSDFTEIKAREQHYREAKLQAEAASTAKSRFLAHMSHELRTPLNAIIGFSEVLASQMFGSLGNGKYVDYATNISQGGHHLLDIISSVLDLAKSEAGKLQLNGEPLDLRVVLADCATMMQDQCTRASLRFDVASQEQPLDIVGEPAKLRQIFLNLLSNAVKFTEPGGSVSMRAGAPMDGAIRVEIADTGIGMAPEDIPIALAPFEQIDSRLARRYEGTGLGLPLAKALVELHGGEITIASEPGKGTRVAVMLPHRLHNGDAGHSLASLAAR
ncbi:MAG: HAMP domain-containing protein [Proteobacteria bacterium]|nr:HAMP domain-containing protein [Pseudomonadota bacterium]MBI3496960.1 HAMP domain-containing protein [Pseudomonadota bacterium]